MFKIKNFNLIINEICQKNNINHELVSDNWLYILEKNDQTRYINGYKFDLNSQGVGNILDDKYAFYEVLTKFKFPVIKHHLILNNYDYKNILSLFYKYKEEVVIKSNDGTCGYEVFYINNEKDLKNTINTLLEKGCTISLCPYYKIKNEYRVIVLNNSIKIIYGKTKPIIIGDGSSTKKELLLKFNKNYFANKILDSSYDEILPKNMKFIYNWQFNLSRGANLFIVENTELKNNLQSLALNICSKTGIKFGSIDIIETTEDKLLVMEANSGVMMDNFINLYPNGYNIAKKIYEEAILEMFN